MKANVESSVGDNIRTETEEEDKQPSILRRRYKRTIIKTKKWAESQEQKRPNKNMKWALKCIHEEKINKKQGNIQTMKSTKEETKEAIFKQ